MEIVQINLMKFQHPKNNMTFENNITFVIVFPLMANIKLVSFKYHPKSQINHEMQQFHSPTDLPSAVAAFSSR